MTTTRFERFIDVLIIVLGAIISALSVFVAASGLQYGNALVIVAAVASFIGGIAVTAEGVVRWNSEKFLEDCRECHHR